MISTGLILQIGSTVLVPFLAVIGALWATKKRSQSDIHASSQKAETELRKDLLEEFAYYRDELRTCREECATCKQEHEQSKRDHGDTKKELIRFRTRLEAVEGRD